jgi:hypothetical protein
MSTFNFSPSSSAKGSSSNPRRRSPWPSLAQPALGAALAMGVLTAGQAQALVVNVAGQAWNVTTFTGSYNDNTSIFIQPTAPDWGAMPWWGNSSLATQFATAVGDSLLTLNSIPTSPAGDADVGPLFAYSVEHVMPNDSSAFQISYSIAATDFPNTSIFNFSADNHSSFIWAQATLDNTSSPASVPGPLPALGGAAAFGFSRKLRKRIKRSTNTVFSPYGN